MLEVSKQGGNSYRIMQAILLVIFCYGLGAPVATGIIITPQELFLDEYATTQETVVTFYNDGFDPVGCELTPSYESTYLLPYVSFEPSRFILQPDMQQNVRVTTNFPSTLSPQTHELVVAAFRDATETMTIRFRPPGEQRFSLAIQEVTTALSDDEGELTVTMQLKNTGNLFLFVKPQVIIEREGVLVQNFTYRQPVIVPPGETYPLAIRQDTTSFGTGAFGAEVQAHYTADNLVGVTPAYPMTFILTEQAEEKTYGAWDRSKGYIAVAAFIIVVTILWFLPLKRGQRHRKREKHITGQNQELHTLQQEVHAAHHEVEALSKEIRRFADEAEHWLRQQRGAA